MNRLNNKMQGRGQREREREGRSDECTSTVVELFEHIITILS